MLRRGRTTSTIAFALLLAATPLWGQTDTAHGTASRARLLDAVIQAIADRFVDSISANELYDVAARAVVAHLHDRFTVLAAGEAANSWEYGGTGIRIVLHDRSALVVSTAPKSPSAQAGVSPGDRLVTVDGKSIDGWTMADLIHTLRGPVGSQVAVGLRRFGTPEPITVPLTRATIGTNAVPLATLLKDSVGYVAFEAVTPTAADEVSAQVAALKAKGMRALILDLRQNGGGDLYQSVGVADLFLSAGQQIGSTRGRAGDGEDFRDERVEQWPDIPIVVLVSGNTASGGELVTAALQENDRALVMGTVTFGKGIGQTDLSMDDTTTLRLTTFRWNTPTGRNINRANKDTASKQRAEESSDSALRTRPMIRTAGGRQIRAGIGIVPDVIVRASAAERAFDAAVDYAPFLSLAVQAVALDVQRSGAIKSKPFRITPAMHRAVVQRLHVDAPQVPSRVLVALGPVIDEYLQREVAAAVFGPAEGLPYDQQVQLAADLLRKVRTPEDLVRTGADTVAATRSARVHRRPTSHVGATTRR